MTALPNIVLVHGAWANGSSWSAVIEHLQADGYRVTAPQFPLTRLADDVGRPRVLARHHRGGLVQPRGHGLPPRRRAPAHRDGRRGACSVDDMVTRINPLPMGDHVEGPA
jgi:pimeloyl-ACP methyl ester carboxylesterase